MRRTALVSLLAIVLILALAAPSLAWTRGGGGRGGGGNWHGGHWHGGGRVVVGFGVGFGPWWGYPWGPYYPYAWSPYYPYPYAYGPSAVVTQDPPVYIQQQPAAPPTPQTYWYYCPSMQAYYPSVPSCAEPWVKVPPRPQ